MCKDRRYPSFHIRPLGVEGFIAGEGKAGAACLGGEHGPSNDAESLGYRVTRPSVPEDSLFRDLRNIPCGAEECSLRGEDGLANRTACRFSVPWKTRRDKRRAPQSEDRPIRSLRGERRNASPARFYFRNPSIPAPNSAKSYLTGSEASSVRSEAVISSTAFQSFCFRASSPSARPIWPVCTSSGR